MGKATIHIVDDEKEFRESLARLLRVSGGYEVLSFSSGEELLEKLAPPLPACMIVDLLMPGIDGLQLQIELQARKFIIPTIVLSSYSTIEKAVRAVKIGAHDVFQKPCDPAKLLKSVEECCTNGHSRRFTEQMPDNPSYVIRDWDFIARYFKLSARQCEIAQRICQSMSNDAIAYDLFISSNTVRMHIKALYEKLNVNDRVGVAMRCLGADSQRSGERPA